MNKTLEQPLATESLPQNLSIAQIINLPDSRINSELKNILTIVAAEFPELASIKIIFLDPHDNSFMGGCFNLQDEQGNIDPAILVVPNQPKILEKLLTNRKASALAVAKRLKLDPTKLTPTILGQFILAHELGHALDFIRNYTSLPGLTPEEILDEWNFHGESALATLPIPDIYPSELGEQISSLSTVEEVADRFPELRRHPQFSSFKSVQDILDLQEIEYKKLPHEVYADDFATAFLQKHLADFQ